MSNVIWITTEVVMNTGGDYHAANKLCRYLKNFYQDNAKIVFIVINIDSSKIPEQHNADIRVSINVSNIDEVFSMFDMQRRDSAKLFAEINALPNELKTPSMIIRTAKYDCFDDREYQKLFDCTLKQVYPPIIINITEYTAEPKPLQVRTTIGVELKAGLGKGELGVFVEPTVSEQDTQQSVTQLSDSVRLQLSAVTNDSAIIMGYARLDDLLINSASIFEYLDLCLRLKGANYNHFTFLFKLEASDMALVKTIVERHGFKLGRFCVKTQDQPTELNVIDAEQLKHYRTCDFIDPFTIAHKDMLLLQQITNNVVKVRLCTGDQSTVEGGRLNAVNLINVPSHKTYYYTDGIIRHIREVVGEKSLLLLYYVLLQHHKSYHPKELVKLLTNPKIYSEARQVWDDIRKNYNLEKNLLTIIELLQLARTLLFRKSPENSSLFLQKFVAACQENHVAASYFISVYCHYIFEVKSEFTWGDPVINLLLHNQSSSQHLKLSSPLVNTADTNPKVLPVLSNSGVPKTQIPDQSRFFHNTSTELFTAASLYHSLESLPSESQVDFIIKHEKSVTCFKEFILILDAIDYDIRYKYGVHFKKYVISPRALYITCTRLPPEERSSYILLHKNIITSDEDIHALLPLIEASKRSDFLLNFYPLITKKNIHELLTSLPCHERLPLAESTSLVEYLIAESHFDMLESMPEREQMAFMKKYKQALLARLCKHFETYPSFIFLYCSPEIAANHICENLPNLITSEEKSPEEKRKNDNYFIRLLPYILSYLPKPMRLETVKKYLAERKIDIHHESYQESLFKILALLRSDEALALSQEITAAPKIHEYTLVRHRFEQEGTIATIGDLILLTYQNVEDNNFFIINLGKVTDRSDLASLLHDPVLNIRFSSYNKFAILKQIIDLINSPSQLMQFFDWIIPSVVSVGGNADYLFRVVCLIAKRLSIMSCNQDMAEEVKKVVMIFRCTLNQRIGPELSYWFDEYLAQPTFLPRLVPASVAPSQCLTM